MSINFLINKLFKGITKNFASFFNFLSLQQLVYNTNIKEIELWSSNNSTFWLFLINWNKATNKSVFQNLKILFDCWRGNPTICSDIAVVHDFTITESSSFKKSRKNLNISNFSLCYNF